MTAPIPDERLREIAASYAQCPDRSQWGNDLGHALNELLLLRERSAVAEADRALVDAMLHNITTTKHMNLRGESGSFFEEHPQIAACRAARAAEGGDATSSSATCRTPVSNPAPPPASPAAEGRSHDSLSTAMPTAERGGDSVPGPLAAAQLVPEANLIAWALRGEGHRLAGRAMAVADALRDISIPATTSGNIATPPCTDPQHEAAVRLAECCVAWDANAEMFRSDYQALLDAYRAARQPQREEEPVLSAEAIAKLHGIGDKMDDTGYLARVLLIMASDLQRALRRARGDAP